MPTKRAQAPAPQAQHGFMFATGIENSYPVVSGPNGKDMRVDEMAKAGHYERWQEDFHLVKELGIEFLRYGPPYYKTHLGPGKYDWDFADQTFALLQKLNITPIVDLCHFGVPDWVGDFQNPDWPRLFGEYADAFARRFPWLTLYTPVNEIFVCAEFSGLFGWWNERQANDRAFVTALKHMAQANVLAEEAILKAQPSAYFVQSESSEYFHIGDPSARARAQELNDRRFISLDLCYGQHNVCWCIYDYLLENGMTKREFKWFMEHGSALKSHQIMGNDYYISNEHLVHHDGAITPSGEILGYYVITKQYYDRYHLPVMHTETNISDREDAPNWLWKEWTNMMRLRDDGVPIIGFTWYSLIDQVDWDTQLRENNGHLNELGLYDINRKITPVGEAYKRLVSQWRDILPAESSCMEPYITPGPLADAD